MLWIGSQTNSHREEINMKLGREMLQGKNTNAKQTVPFEIIIYVQNRH